MPICQSIIINQCQKYVQLQQERFARDFPDEKPKYVDADIQKLVKSTTTGVCSGLSGLWLYRKSRGEESQFFGILELIAAWNGTEESLKAGDNFLAKVFEQFINDMRWVQNSSADIRLKYNVQQRDLVDKFEIIKRVQKNQGRDTPSLLSLEFSMAFVFKKDELLETLSNVVNEGKMIRLGGANHTIAMMKKNGKYVVYDPNASDGEKTFDTIVAVEDYIEKVLFKDFGYSSENLPIDISVFDFSNKKPHRYKKTAKEMIESFLRKNGEVDRLSWDKYTPLIFASRMGEQATAQLLVQMKADLNKAADVGLLVDYYTPLIAAVDKRQTDIVRMLATSPGVNLDRLCGGTTPLIFAAQEGYIDIVGVLLETNVNINQKDIFGNTALMLAVGNGHLELVLELLRAGVFVNEKNSMGVTALMMAVSTRNAGMVKALLGAGAPTDTQDIKGRTSLMLAINCGDVDSVRALVSAGANIHQKDNNGRTAFLMAAESEQAAIVNALLEIENINQKDDKGKTALMLAFDNGYLTLFETLLKKKSILINEQDNEGKTALMLAVRRRDVDSVRALIEAGSDVNVKDRNGKTAIIYAVEIGSIEIINLLLEANAMVNEKDNDKKTALMYAADSRSVKATGILLASGVLVNEKDNKEMTALMIAASNGNSHVVEALLGAGVSKDEQNMDGKTALMLAVSSCDLYSVQALIVSGANVNLKDKEGTSALMQILSKKIFDSTALSIIQSLLEKGATVGDVDKKDLEALRTAKGIRNTAIIKLLDSAPKLVAAPDALVFQYGTTTPNLSSDKDIASSSNKDTDKNTSSLKKPQKKWWNPF